MNGATQTIDAPKIALQEFPPATKRQRLTWEKELLGLYISDHPLRGYEDYFAAKATAIRNISNSLVNHNITVGGIITKLQKVHTRNNQLMYFVTIEDGVGKLEALIFPKVIEKNPEIWKEESILLLKGRLSDKDNEFKLICNEGIVVDEAELEKFKKEPQGGESFSSAATNRGAYGHQSHHAGPAFIKGTIELCLEEDCDRTVLDKISKVVCDAGQGECKIYISLKNSPSKLETPHRIAYNEEVIEKLKNIVGEENVLIQK